MIPGSLAVGDRVLHNGVERDVLEIMPDAPQFVRLRGWYEWVAVDALVRLSTPEPAPTVIQPETGHAKW